MSVWEIVEGLTEFMAYCCAERKNKESIVYHEQWVGLSSLLQHFRIKAVEKKIKRAHVEAGNQTRARRPLTWEIIKVMDESIGE